MKRFFMFTLLATLVLGACAPVVTPTPAVDPTSVPEPEPTMVPLPKTIVDIAVEDGRFTTLVAAVQAADLVETLQGEGPFTVFAPTDDAFAKLPAGTLEEFVKTGKQTNVDRYPSLPRCCRKVMASDVVNLTEAVTVFGDRVAVKVDAGKVYINDAEVIITDIEASNGIIHVIDTVILPPAEEKAMDIVDTAIADGRFTTLVAAVQAAGLVDTLKGEGPFTVFAPTDDAFAKLPAGTIEALLKPENKQQLTDILLYHVMAGKVMAESVTDGLIADSALGYLFILQTGYG